jgi:hypothetical protein
LNLAHNASHKDVIKPGGSRWVYETTFMRILALPGFGGFFESDEPVFPGSSTRRLYAVPNGFVSGRSSVEDGGCSAWALEMDRLVDLHFGSFDLKHLGVMRIQTHRATRGTPHGLEITVPDNSAGASRDFFEGMIRYLREQSVLKGVFLGRVKK